MNNSLFNENLRKHKAIFDSMADKYSKESMPEVKTYNIEFRGTGTYPYNSLIKGYIMGYIMARETIDTDLLDHLGTEVYLSQQDIREDLKKIKDEKMIAEGYTPIPKPPHTCEYRGKALLKVTETNDWVTSNIEMEGKIINTHDNRGSFFIPKGKRSRGYYFEMLEGYYKPIIK